jgi:hypothetical protein
VFFVALVLFGKDPFEPMCLFVSEPLIHERGIVTYEDSSPQPSHYRLPHTNMYATSIQSWLQRKAVKNVRIEMYAS